MNPVTLILNVFDGNRRHLQLPNKMETNWWPQCLSLNEFVHLSEDCHWLLERKAPTIGPAPSYSVGIPLREPSHDPHAPGNMASDGGGQLTQSDTFSSSTVQSCQWDSNGQPMLLPDRDSVFGPCGLATVFPGLCLTNFINSDMLFLHNHRNI